MTVDPEDGLVTDFMFGMMLVFGADIILFACLLWIVGHVSTPAFLTITAVIVAVFGGWIGWRWREIRRVQSTHRTPIEELKHQYAAGELSEADFEAKLNHLVEADERIDETEPTLER